MKYNPIEDSFVSFEAVETPRIEISLPLVDSPIDISNWSQKITENGTPIVQNNLRNPMTNNNSRGRQEIIEPSTEETLVREEYSNTPAKKTITKQDQKNNALTIMNNLVRRGYQPHVAAGITGNLMAESGLNPSNSANDLGVKGGGLAAWRGDLFQNLKRNAKSNNVPWNDINFQLDYLDNLLKQDNSQMNDVRNRLSRSKDPYEASEAWAYYERYAGYDGSTRTAKKAGWNQSRINQEHEKRGNYAKEIYELWKKQS